MIKPVIDHLDTETIEDEPDRRERTARDGSSIIVTSPAMPAAPDPNEIVSYDAFGYPETRSQQAEGLKAQAGEHQTFHRFWRLVQAQKIIDTWGGTALA